MPRPSRQAIYERLDRAVEDLNRMGGLPTVQEARSIWEGIWQEEAHHSTAVEGNTLLRREVQLLLFEGRAVGGRELREYLEVQGYGDAAMWVYGHAVKAGSAPSADVPRHLTLAELREIHRLVVEPVWARFSPENLPSAQQPGDFRRSNVEPLRRGLRPPDWPEVHALLSDWVDRAGAPHQPSRRHLMEELADFHADFERIHPFPDGNGRVGRLALNLLLVRQGYPPAVVNKRDRDRYLDGLHRADDGDPGLLGEVLARSVEHGINRFLIPGLAGPHRWVPLTSLTDMGFTYNALILAAQRGRLRADQQNGRWYSSRSAVEEYRRQRYRRQPA